MTPSTSRCPENKGVLPVSTDDVVQPTSSQLRFASERSHDTSNPEQCSDHTLLHNPQLDQEGDRLMQIEIKADTTPTSTEVSCPECDRMLKAGGQCVVYA